MKLAANKALDALCGEYLLGTLRGPARRRFERALREEPSVASRLAYWQATLVPEYGAAMEVKPSARVWRSLRSDLHLDDFRAPLLSRLGFWRGLAAASTAALVLLAVSRLLPVDGEPPVLQPIARLESGKGAAPVLASLSRDGRTLALSSERALQAGPQQSYELWLLPADGGAPQSVAVLATLSARVPVPESLRGRMVDGAKLAVSVEPPGGSPTGAPTGPVIMVGSIGTV